MIIAVAYNNGNIPENLGQVQSYKLYEISGGCLLAEEVIETPEGFANQSDRLSAYGVSVLIYGNIPLSARMAFDKAGITLYGGLVGHCDDAISHFMDGTFPYQEALVRAPQR